MKSSSVLQQSMATMFSRAVAAIVALTSLCPSASAADTLLRLHYEWADGLDGPWTAVPPEVLQIAKDGSITIVTDKERKFFRVNVNEAGKAGVAAVPFSSLAPEHQRVAIDHINGIRSADIEDEEALDWKSATISPIAIPIFSPWNTSGKPDAMELKILPPATSPQPGALLPSPEYRTRGELGYLIIGVGEEMPSIVEFSTRGQTMCEKLLARCGNNPVSRIVRWAPTYIVAEDSTGDSLGSLGFAPVILTDQQYANAARGKTYEIDSEVPGERVTFDPQPEPPLFRTYKAFSAAYRSSLFLAERRRLKLSLLDFDRKAALGLAPSEEIVVGNRISILPSKIFSTFVLDAEDMREAPVEVTLPRTGGASLVARTPGSWRLTLREADGTSVRRLINVVASARSATRLAPRDVTPVLVSKSWKAVQPEDQPRLDQSMKDDDWCDVVGCGPVALQMLFAWWDQKKGVTSLYYDRLNSSNLINSMRVSDAPLDMDAGGTSGRANLRRWYNYWHDACDVICAAGNGATWPTDLTDAMFGYASVQGSNLFGTALGADGPLIGYHCKSEVDWDGDDWDEAGILLAESIKQGRPGVTLYWELMHYMLGYSYKRWRYEIPGSPFQPPWNRAFKCNMGWGDDFCWMNAYDIDGAWVGRFWQKNLPPAQ